MGRTNQRSQRVLKTETAVSNTETENVYLKERNAELAKALAETQMLYKRTLDDRNYIHKELFGATLRIKKLENYISNIDVSARETINCIVALSGHATEILNFVTCSRRISSIGTSFTNLNETPNNPQSCSMNKTQAVKPMIDGHVIYSPTINLRRVNTNSVAEIQSRRSTNHLQNIETYYNDGTGEDGNNLSANNSFERRSSTNRQYRHISERRALDEVNDDLESNEETSTHSEDIQLNISDIRRLSTVEEDEMENSLPLSNRRNSSSNNNRSHNLRGDAGQVPILSGVFRDVRVYLSPVDPLPHITKVRGSSKSHKFKSSDIQANRSTEAGPSTDNYNMNDEVGGENVEENDSNLSNKFPKGTCSSTPITSFVCNQSTSALNVGNSSAAENLCANTRTRKRRRTTDHTNPKKLVFNKASQFDNNRSCVSDDDPLEGPSSLLDSTHLSKLHTLSQLGLSPISAVNMSSSPTDTVLPESRESSEGNASTSNKQGNHFVTKRKLEKRKSVVVSSKVGRTGTIRFTRSPQEISFQRSRMSKLQISPKSNNSTPSNLSAQSPSNSPSGMSPKKRGRPRRAAAKESLKEPSLRKKLRRSK